MTKANSAEMAMARGSSPTGISDKVVNVTVSIRVMELESGLTTKSVLPSVVSANIWLDVERLLVVGALAEEVENWQNQSPVTPNMNRKMHNNRWRIDLNAML